MLSIWKCANDCTRCVGVCLQNALVRTCFVYPVMNDHIVDCLEHFELENILIDCCVQIAIQICSNSAFYVLLFLLNGMQFIKINIVQRRLMYLHRFHCKQYTFQSFIQFHFMILDADTKFAGKTKYTRNWYIEIWPILYKSFILSDIPFECMINRYVNFVN